MMIICCYIKASLTNSEQTKIEKHMYLSEETPKYLVNINAKNYKQCEFCQTMKFSTASHCKYCNYCVLRRDHHCIWIGNCVGLQNNQYFFNFCFWVIIGTTLYIRSFYLFYIKHSEVYEYMKFSEPNIIENFIIYYISCSQAGVLFSVSYLLAKQILYIYLGSPFYNFYKSKNPESYFPCKTSNNTDKEGNEYNKGYIVNFFYVIGPSLFHLVFPIMKENNYDIVENNPIMKPNKSSNGIELINFLRNQDRVRGQEIYEEENRKMDPRNYLDSAKNIYKNYSII